MFGGYVPFFVCWFSRVYEQWYGLGGSVWGGYLFFVFYFLYFYFLACFSYCYWLVLIHKWSRGAWCTWKLNAECYATGLLSVFISRVVWWWCVVDVAAIDPCTCMSGYILHRLALDVLHRVGFCRHHIILWLQLWLYSIRNMGEIGTLLWFECTGALELGQPYLFISRLVRFDMQV